MLSDININNNVKIDELFDNKSWIHGKNKENIKYTIFLITINGHQLEYSLNSINNLDVDESVLINVIMNVSPTNKAYNLMRIRCKTEYFIQLDEDMELFQNSISIINESIKLKGEKVKKYFLHTFKLIDNYLGISNPPVIYGIKIYNNKIMKKYPTFKDGSQSISSVDQLWHKQIEEDGFRINTSVDILGYHALHRNYFDLLLRYCKITKSILDPKIKVNSAMICKVLRPINNINNFDKLYNQICMHFICYGFQKEIFLKNNKLFSNDINRWISSSRLKMYGLKSDCTRISLNNDYNFNRDFFLELFTLPLINVKDIYCIIGVINSLFENYSYSFENYPYKIFDYFNKIFKMNIITLSNDLNLIKFIKESFNNSNIINIEYVKEYDKIDNDSGYYDIFLTDSLDKKINNCSNLLINSNFKDIVDKIKNIKRNNKISYKNVDNLNFFKKNNYVNNVKYIFDEDCFEYNW